MHLLWLIPIVAMGIWQIFVIHLWPQAWLNLIVWAPFVMAGLGVFIAFWLNRLQPVLILITLIAFNLWVHFFIEDNHTGISSDLLLPFLATLLPINIFIWGSFPERGLRNLSFLGVGLLVLLVQIAGCFWILETLPTSLMTWFSKPLPVFHGIVHLPLFAFVTFVILILLQIIKNALNYQLKVLDSTIVFIFILLAMGLNYFAIQGAIAWMSTLIGFMVLLSMIFDAHLLAYTDPLTGLPTRRALYETFSGLRKNYAVAMMDIDHFKKFNDTYGHDIGDKVLCTVADDLRQARQGKVFRFGGEEFVLVFKKSTAEQAKQLVEEVRELIAHHVLEFKHKDQKEQVNVTVSFGVATKTPNFKSPEAVMKAADEALYQAKQGGRNKTAIYGDKPVKKAAKRIKQ